MFHSVPIAGVGGAWQEPRCTARVEMRWEVRVYVGTYPTELLRPGRRLYVLIGRGLMVRWVWFGLAGSGCYMVG